MSRPVYRNPKIESMYQTWLKHYKHRYSWEDYRSMEEGLNEESEFLEANLDRLIAEQAVEREMEEEERQERDEQMFYSGYPEEKNKAIRKLQAEYQSLKQQFKSLQEQLEPLHAKQHRLQQQLMPLQREYTKTQKTINALQGDIDKIEQRASRIKKDISKLQSIH